MRLRSLVPLTGMLVGLPVHADAAPLITVEHDAPLPCAVACPYWEPGSLAGFDECAEPFPEGSYDYTTFRLTSATEVVHIEARSVIDYDTFVCTDTEPSVLVDRELDFATWCPIRVRGSNVHVGCIEDFDITLDTLHAKNNGVNDRFRVISYNWADIAPLLVRLRGPVEVVDDTYEAPLQEIP